MVYKSLQNRILGQMVMFGVSCFLISWFILIRKEWIPVLFLGIFLILQVLTLFRYLNQTNRKLTLFFKALRNGDHSLNYTSKMLPDSFQELYSEMQLVQDQIQLKNCEQEAKNQFHRTINDHIATGVICFDSKERILLINKAACHLLASEQFSYLSFLKKDFRELYDIFTSIQINQQKICKLWNRNKLSILSVQSTSVNMADDRIKIVSFHDIKNEMDEKELEAWQKLIRVIAHEIMNSIAPITSLSETLLKYYVREDGSKVSEELNPNRLENTVDGLLAIKDRGMELSKFVDLYRKLTRIPQPNIQKVFVKDIFSRLVLLAPSGTVKMDVQYLQDDLFIQADSGLLMQVLINVVKNAEESIDDKHQGTIKIKAEVVENGVVISVSDNGKGIDPSVLENIFMPFFTTKENGSGIGLSFSHQVMRLHGGKIMIESKPNFGTNVKLCF